MKQRIVITGGGTAGHVYPGLSVAESIKKKEQNIEILWIGSKHGMEQKIVEDAGIEFIGILSGKLRRYFSFQNFIDIFKIAAGLFQALHIIRKYKPAIVFSKGGFVSVPPVYAAGISRIPVISHESDMTPGLATRLNKRFSKKIFVSYEKTKAYLPDGRTILSGNPIRAAIMDADADRGREMLKAGDKKIIMIIGGSQGALQINRLIESIVNRISEKYYIIHQTGKHVYEGEMPEDYKRYEYIGRELPDLLAAADLVISRAGASTIWENAALGKPAILIPLGTGSSRGDQGKNAGVFRDAGAAEVLYGDVSAEELYGAIEEIMNDNEKRAAMGRNAKSLLQGNPADIIADNLLEEIKKCR